MDLPDAFIPLRQWIASEQLFRASSQTMRLKNQSLLRTATVAYAVVELLRHAKKSLPVSSNNSECSLDNFVVQLSSSNPNTESSLSWNNIVGASMISHALDVHIIEPSFLIYDVAETNSNAQEDGMGMYLEAEITPSSLLCLPTGNGHLDPAETESSDSDRSDCQKFGLLLYEMYSGRPPSAAETHNDGQWDNTMRGNDTAKKRAGHTSQHQKSFATLQELGLPSSFSLLVQQLIEGNSLYSSLEAASNDIHLLLHDPECYLFDHHVSSASPQLRIKEGKVYGREKEVSLITDAFCQVSSGKNLALFIGGYSGSGKSTLVQNVTTRVDIAGGYVLTQKVDQMSKERPSDVLSAFNKLCLLIREKNSPHELTLIENRLLLEFESDLSVLARLLPNIHLLCPRYPQQNLGVGVDRNLGVGVDSMILNSHNVNFVLQRFMRIVSSKERPVMLFLDDLQWAGSPALDVIYAILSDTRGSSCIFFIGSYRDNEVEDDHPVYELMANLDLASVETNQFKLSGLRNEDLNVMISEFLCVLPRICKPFSDIVFSKTEGNPFFAIEFLKSLVDSRLLEYSLRERKWIWDEDKIRYENIAANVLYLLTDKMSSLPENVQFALKALSCFGIKTDKTIVDYLSSTEQYSGFPGWLDRAISERYIQKLGRKFKFCHDKVREAAYSLIPEGEKSQFHHDIGLLLYSVSQNQNMDDAVMFQIADQINFDLLLVKPRMQLDIAKLNVNAGSVAMDRSDFTTAHSYLTNALSLLPKDHWESQYEFSLELFFLRAKAAYSCGSTEEAKQSLSKMIAEGRCIDDIHILDAHHYYIKILHFSHEREKAFISCRTILLQFNEQVPDDVNASQMSNIAEETNLSLSKMSDEDFYTMKAMDGSCHNVYIIKFYSTLTNICYQYKAELMPWLTCRMINLTIEHGISSDSLKGLIQHAATLCQISMTNVEGAYKIGKVALNILKRFDSPEMVSELYHLHFGFIAQYVEPIQSCSQMLRKGFEVGMSTGGEFATAFHSAIFIIRFGILGGENLPSLLKDTIYYLELSNQFDHKLSQVYFLIFHEVLSTLIGRSTASCASVIEPPAEELINSSTAYLKAHYMYNMFLSFWQGYTQRCNYFVDKLLEIKFLGAQNRVFVMFYGALNSFRATKQKKGSTSKNTRVMMRARKAYNDAMAVLKSAEAHSSWNYSNKIRLLEAEYHSFAANNGPARAAYKKAISLSRSSSFVHEQGLAAECAAFHSGKNGEIEQAINYFNQAKECYTKWGSQIKVDSINRQLEMAQNNMA